MATQPPAPPPNGRESLSLSLGGRSVAVQAANLTTILLLMLLGGGGYMLWASTDHRLEAILAGQGRLQDTAHANKEAVIQALHEIQTYITEQVTASQQRILTREQAHQEHLQEVLEVIQTMLRVSEYNRYQPPEGRLPLDIPLGSLGKPVQPSAPR